MCRDTQNAAADTKMVKIAYKNVSTCQRRPRRPNSPLKVETETPKCPKQWKHDRKKNDAYTPHNVPVEALGAQN